MSRWLKQFDVRRYGAKAGYVDATNAASRGRNNLAAFQACAADLSASGGGDFVIPRAKYGYWCPGSVTFTTSYNRVQNEGVVRYDPDAPGSLFRWESPIMSGGTETLFKCGLYGGEIRGHIADDPGAGTRHAKSAVELVCTAGFEMRSVVVVDMTSNTGATPSKAVRLRGRDLTTIWNCYLAADRVFSIEANPKARTDPAGPIDADHFHFQSNYCQGANPTSLFPDEPIIHVDPDLNFLDFRADGNNNAALGSGIFYWDDPAGGALHRDSVGLLIKGWRSEQQTSAKPNIHISRRGVAPAFGVVIDDISMGLAAVGVNLEGTQRAIVRDSRYYRTYDQDTSPMALVLAASCAETVVERYDVPRVPGIGPAVPLYDVGALLPYDVDGTALTWPKTTGISQLYDYQRFM